MRTTDSLFFGMRLWLAQRVCLFSPRNFVFRCHIGVSDDASECSDARFSATVCRKRVQTRNLRCDSLQNRVQTVNSVLKPAKKTCSHANKRVHTRKMVFRRQIVPVRSMA